MWFWVFLSIVVASNYAYKAFKLSMNSRDQNFYFKKIKELQEQVEQLKREVDLEGIEKRIETLEESVLFGDFELKKKFQNLEEELESSKKKSS